MKKIASVTGARRGIGRAITEALLQEGYHVLMSGASSEKDTREILEELKQKGGSVEYKKCDIGKAEDRKALTAYIRNTYGRLDLHVNNAGVAPKERRDILEMSEESFSYVVDTNLKGTFFFCQEIANLMLEYRKNQPEDYSPRIINLSSISAETVSCNRGEYCISKAGISMTTKLFAARLAQEGIGVFEVRPGIIRTDMTKKVTEVYEKLIAEGITPIRRMGEPKDVADCVMAIASGRLDFAAGQVLYADGGFHISRL